MSSHDRAPRLLRAVALAAIVAVLLPGVASAQSAGRKAGRGLAAMTTAFLEVPGNIHKGIREDGPTSGMTLGFAVGLGQIVPRVLVGVYEFLTSPFPAPAGFKPILSPEFPWSYFEEPRPAGLR